MADVFISYSQKDRDVAQGLADFLGRCGYDVWWDYELVGGVRFRNKIKEELAKARSAIVIWTPNSVESDWVIEEAEEAKLADKLIATRIDGLDYRGIPLGFRSLQTDVVTGPERILKALETLGVAPSRPPTPPKPDPVVIGKGLDPEAIARAEAFAHWEFIKDSSDPAAFANFIGMFPASTFAPLARIQLGKLAEQAWQGLGGSEDVAALGRFAQQFPDDARAAEAKKRIGVIESRAAEAQSWARVQESGDIGAVESHIARHPAGANAPAARALLQQLRRERDAEQHWHALAEETAPEPFEQFLAAYADTTLAARARARLEELRRAQEEKDWNAVRHERHPAPLLRFLKAHPRGARSAEAFDLLGALPRTMEQEAWAAIKDGDQPILFQGYLAALPYGQNAKAARARLKALEAGRPAAAAPPSPKAAAVPLAAIAMPADKPAAAAAPASSASDQHRRQHRRALYLLLPVLGLLTCYLTAVALNRMSSQYGASDVSTNLLNAALCLGLAAVMLYFFGRSGFAERFDSPARASIVLHAAGSLAILVWIALTQAIAEGSHAAWNNIDNVMMGQSAGYSAVLAGVFVGALLTVWSQKLVWLKWMPIVWYGLVALIGFGYVASWAYYLDGLGARDYWVSTSLGVFGGAALLVFSAIVIVTRIAAWRRIGDPRLAK